MENTKKWWESRTVWVNVVSLLIAVVSQLSGWTDLQSFAPYLLVISNLLNLALRFLTTTTIE